jgi:hypothetical protein
MDVITIKECIGILIGKRAAEKYHLDFDIGVWPERWYGGRPWTASMRKRFFSVYPPSE